MAKVLIEHIIHLIIVLPIILLTLKNRKADTMKILLIFMVFFLVNSILLNLPLEYKELRIINGKWNWTGKIFAIFGSFVFLLLYRKYDLKDYYLTLNQNKPFLKKGILIITIILLVEFVMNFIYNPPEKWNTETILFQLTMPGIDEEIAYRGIMLGLLTKILNPFFTKTFFHPAILVTGILFGLAHGLFLTNSFELSFKSSPFFFTMILGIIWSWITIKSGSILLALISHNLGNVSGKLISMR